MTWWHKEPWYQQQYGNDLIILEHSSFSTTRLTQVRTIWDPTKDKSKEDKVTEPCYHIEPGTNMD